MSSISQHHLFRWHDHSVGKSEKQKHYSLRRNTFLKKKIQIPYLLSALKKPRILEHEGQWWRAITYRSGSHSRWRARSPYRIFLISEIEPKKINDREKRVPIQPVARHLHGADDTECPIFYTIVAGLA
jgi:hypothetical protein